MQTRELAQTGTGSTQTRMRILVADDDELQRRLLSHLLAGRGHEVVSVADGAQAWEALQSGSFNMVFTDWLMPEVSGLELTRRIRATFMDRYLYVIVCTAKSSRADLIEALTVGADDFLSKPIQKDELWVRLAAGERVIRLETRLEEDKRHLAEINQKLSHAYQTIHDDLQAAARMQRSLLPVAATIQNIHFDSLFLPASGVAGDIFNYFALSNNSVGFYALDVSGHGIPAAMLSVTLSKMLTTRPLKNSPLVEPVLSGEGYRVRPPDEAIAELNRRFQDQGDMYFTMAYGVLNQKEKRLQLVQAGHPSPILLRLGQPPVTMGDGGFPVGVVADMTYDLIDEEIEKGDRLFLSSDGILECANRNGEQFGTERLMEFLDKHRRCSLESMMRSLEWTMQGWAESPEFADDVSLLALEVS
ncbi:MAG TPA: SpoIIE family protein phosphatase [Candidatus Angelobacter sp.]|nr:SpoIIE family protein phosphatase [Candidatus Angelobacter sp.]